MVDRPGLVVKKIDPALDIGQVRVDGQVWQATSDTAIDEGAKIKVLKILGARLHVVKLEE